MNILSDCLFMNSEWYELDYVVYSFGWVLDEIDNYLNHKLSSQVMSMCSLMLIHDECYAFMIIIVVYA